MNWMLLLAPLMLGTPCTSHYSYVWEKPITSELKADWRQAIVEEKLDEAYAIFNELGRFVPDYGAPDCAGELGIVETVARLIDAASAHLMPEAALGIADKALSLQDLSNKQLAKFYSSRACLLRWPKPVEALEDVQKAIKLDPSNGRLLMQFATMKGGYLGFQSLFRRKQESRDTFRLVRRALALAPDDPVVLNNAISIYYATPQALGGDNRMALNLARHLTSIDAHLGHFNQGRVYMVARRFKQARRHFRIAIDQPTLTVSAKIWFSGYLAALLAEWRRDDEAYELLKQLKSEFPQHSMPLMQLAVHSVNADHRHEEGIKNLEAWFAHPAALAVPWVGCNYEAPYPWAHYLMGKLYDRLNDKPNARLHYQKSLELSPTLEEARLALKRLD